MSKFFEIVGDLKTLPKLKKKKDGTPLSSHEFRIEVHGKYENVIPFSIKDLKKFEGKVGDEVLVKFFLTGREWQDLCFLDAKAFEVAVVKENAQTTVAEKLQVDDDDDESDDLPY